ncbi:MAG: methyltransferase domain-containing protein [Cyclobacteriaceae bacterium]
MTDIKNTREQNEYWSQRYQDQRTGWDIGHSSTPLNDYIDQLENKDLKILIPGAGNAYEAEYLFKNGFSNVIVLDIAAEPLEAFQKRNPDFPPNQLIHGNFFEHTGSYDIIFEQTFFCSFSPTSSNRSMYAKHMHKLLAERGKLVGLWFDIPLDSEMGNRPFGGSKDEYLQYLSPYFETKTFEKAYNSIADRAGSELFGIFQKKMIS